MTALKVLYEALNFKNITTYIQSGNVIFQSDQPDLQDLSKRIEQKIYETYHFHVPVIVRNTQELKEILENNPFFTHRKEDTSKLHVTFLSEEPEPELLDKVTGIDSAPDEFFLSGRNIYLFCPNGYGRTKLNNTFFERKLKTVATTRNWNTVSKLVDIANGSST